MKVCVLALVLVLTLFQAALSVPIKRDAKEGCIVTDFYEVGKAINNCQDIILDNLYVPPGSTLRLSLREGTTLTFKGNTTFGYHPWEGPLVAINGTNVLIEGEAGAILDGQGPLYWDGKGQWGSVKPKFFVIQLHDSVMRKIYVLNSPIHCVLLADSVNVELSEWVIDNQAGDEEAAGENRGGHNTDGFDIWNGTDVLLKNSIVYNQDDCVAIRCGANILVDDMICIGGHGLSLSVGFSNVSYLENKLENVTISNSILKGGQNAIHIKTHVDGTYGLIRNITYKNIVFDGPGHYGIKIQENYRDARFHASQSVEPKNNIPIVHLVLEDIIGIVEPSAVPININCAQLGCFDWIFTNILVQGSKKNSCNYTPVDFSC